MEIKTVQPHTTLRFSVNQKRGVGGRAWRYIYAHRENSVPVEIGERFSRMKSTQNVKIIHSVKPFGVYGA